MKRPQDLVVDLANCEDEPIRTPGAIQPHGLMIVVDYDLQILQVSTNTGEILEYEASALVEQNISALMSGEDLSLLKRFLDFESLQTLVPIPITLLSSAGKTFKSTCQGHRYSEYFILEFEPVVEDHLQQVLSVSGLLANSIAHLQSAQSLSDVMHIAADEVKKMTGYDRVMVYKFDKDWHGEVIAEAKQESLEPLLGLHYPAADIPVQARELYKRNLTRMIVDVDYNSCAIVPQINQKTNTILDMSDCVLRSVSPIHVEYLTNMGVRATLTISLMVKGELWGLIACHHYSTKYLPLVLRSASQMFGQHLSLALQGYSRAERYKTAAINLRAFDDFFAVFRTTNGDIVKAFEMWGEKLIDTFNCCGTALMTKDVIYAIGETLSDSEIKKAISSIEQFNAPVFATDSICTIKDLNGKSDLAGMLAWKISAINNDWIMCFRPEQSKSVKWAGRPQKDVEVVNNKGRLHPRGSFALWIEQVKNTSEPWAEHNIDTAEYLRTKILELRQESIDRDREDHNKTTTARDEFVANIAHDLKTPILGAIKVLEFIRDGHIGGVEKQSSRGNGPSSNDNCSIYRNDESSISSNSSSPKNILGTTSGEIIPETTQLRTIIDQLITSHQQLFERVKSILILYQYSEDTDPLAVETLDLKTLLQEAIDISMPLARAEKVEIELKVLDDASVVGDCDAFRRVFQNLLSNAVKFSEIGGKVQVTLKADDAKVTIEVHDTGRGVPEEDLGFLFKRFWRGASGKKYTAGTGLGLHVCRKIIDAHKGKIWCNSVVGKAQHLPSNFLYSGKVINH